MKALTEKDVVNGMTVYRDGIKYTLVVKPSQFDCIMTYLEETLEEVLDDGDYGGMGTGDSGWFPDFYYTDSEEHISLNSKWKPLSDLKIIGLDDVNEQEKYSKEYDETPTIETAEEFCERIDEEEGEAWCNTYDGLPKKMQEYAEYYHQEMIKINEDKEVKIDENKIIKRPPDYLLPPM